MKAPTSAAVSADVEARVDSIREPYLQALALIERLHRRLLDLLKDEFDRHGRSEINPVQALMLFSIGDQELCVSELRTRGYYLGTNVSYNLKKLMDTGLVEHRRFQADRRSVRIKLTLKGREAYEIVHALCLKHTQTVTQVGGVNDNEFAILNKLLRRLERFWIDQMLYRL